MNIQNDSTYKCCIKISTSVPRRRYDCWWDEDQTVAVWSHFVLARPAGPIRPKGTACLVLSPEKLGHVGMRTTIIAMIVLNQIY